MNHYIINVFVIWSIIVGKNWLRRINVAMARIQICENPVLITLLRWTKMGSCKLRWITMSRLLLVLAVVLAAWTKENQFWFLKSMTNFTPLSCHFRSAVTTLVLWPWWEQQVQETPATKQTNSIMRTSDMCVINGSTNSLRCVISLYFFAHFLLKNVKDPIGISCATFMN